MKYYLILLIVVFCSCKDNYRKSESFAISTDGVKISYEIAGKGKPTIVFIHGWANNRSIWDVQIAHFAKIYSVIAVDLAGFGDSGNKRDNWAMSSFGDDVASVIKHLDVDQAILVGFSMGGQLQ